MKRTFSNLSLFLFISFTLGQTYVPDDNFEQALIDLGYDDVLDNYVVTDSISGVNNLYLNSIPISDLTGIEDFVSLDSLFLGGLDIDSVDLTSNTSLVYLKTMICQQMSSVNVTGLTLLDNLTFVGATSLASLDVSSNIALTTLGAYGLGSYDGILTTLNVSANTALTKLYLNDNALTTLDVSTNTALTTLYCHNNNLTALDVNANTALTVLASRNNAITNLDVSANTALTYLGCSNNQLTYLNMRNGITEQLTSFIATGNSLDCIEVNEVDVDYATANWTYANGNIDEGVIFSESCSATTAEISVSPTELNEELFEGDSETQTLTITNDGGDDLIWELSINTNRSFGIRNTSNSSLHMLTDELRYDHYNSIDINSNYVQDPNDLYSGDRNNIEIEINRDSEEEIFGNTNNSSTGSQVMKGNIFYVDNSTILLEQKIYLSIDSPTELYFMVYEGDNHPGSYTKISEIIIEESGIGEGWYSSGNIEVPLNSEKYYYIVADWSSTVTYFWSNESVPISTSFGSLVTREGDLAFPPPAGLNLDAESLSPYFQSIVTGSSMENSYLSTSTTSGTIPSGLSEDIQVTFNAEDLNSGEYTADIVITSNDSVNPVVNVPVTLNVISNMAEISVSPTELNEQLVEGDSSAQVLTISNGGSIDLEWEILNQGGGGSDSSSISTLFEGGNAHQGNMFDITPLTDINIQKFDVHPYAGAINMEVYYKTGSYLNYESDLSAWTLVGTADIVGVGFGTSVELPVGDFNLYAGETYGIYITITGPLVVTLNYTDGYNTYSNGDLELSLGTGGPYGDCSYTPRTWNGTIYYSTSLSNTVNWLSTSETSGIIPAEESADITVNFDATEVTAGSYSSSISINSNDTVNPVIDVPVSLEVTPAYPDISVSPGSLSEELVEGETSTQTLTIFNEGDADLDWTISLENSEDSLALCNVGNDVYLENERQVSPNFLLGSMFTLEEAGFIEYLNAIGGPSADVASSQAQLALYSDDGNRDAANLVVSTAIFDLVTGDNQYPVESSTWLEAGDYWILGVYSSTAYIGGLDTGGDVQYVDHTFGTTLPTDLNISEYCCRTFNYYMTVTCPGRNNRVSDAERDILSLQGYTYVPMNQSRDLAWLSTDPATGTLVPGTSQDVVVAFDATNIGFGDFAADLSINSNDPDEPNVNVPVSVEVTPAPPVIAAIEDTSMDEDSELSLQLSAESAQGYQIFFEAESDTPSVYVYVEDDSLHINLETDWNGSSEITVLAYTEFSYESNDVTSFILTVNSVDDLPYVDGHIYPRYYPEDFGVDTVAYLPDVFVDIDGDLTFSYMFTDGGVVAADVSSDHLVLSSLLNVSGTTQLLLTASNPMRASVTDTVDIEVWPVEDPPVVDIPDQLMMEDSEMFLDISGYMSDAESEELWVYVGYVSAPMNDHVDAHMHGSDTLHLISHDNWNGTGDIEINVSDGEQETSDVFALEVRAVNDEPVFENLQALVPAGIEFHVPIHVYDIDMDSLVVTFDQSWEYPEWLSLDDNPYALTGTAPEPISIHFPLQVTDAEVTITDTFHLSAQFFNPRITSVTDVPEDQGGRVYVSFLKSFFDHPDGTNQMYTVFRHDIVDNAPDWVVVGSGAAIGEGSYTYEVSTLMDSTSEGNGMTEFKVVASMDEGHFHSLPESGYSTDDIAPGVPQGLMAVIVNDGIQLTWEMSADEDFQYFMLEKSSDEVFTEPEVFETIDIAYLDLDYVLNESNYYRIAAVDHAGNISEYSDVVDIAVLAIDLDLIPEVFALHQNYPNPFNPTTQIKYDLPEDAMVSITIYDAMGRRVKSLVNTTQSAGYRSIQWNATNSLGEPVSAGMYIYMIQAGKFRQTKKMVLLK